MVLLPQKSGHSGGTIEIRAAIDGYLFAGEAENKSAKTLSTLRRHLGNFTDSKGNIPLAEIGPNDERVKGGSCLLRHTFATFYLRNDGDIERLGLILGHAALSLIGRYAHLGPTEKYSY